MPLELRGRVTQIWDNGNMDSSALLATLSQSAAAMVAIIGGFLVSRLVVISSEREGLKRQLKAARERLKVHRADYEPAHEYRLNNSIATMEGWLREKLIDERVDSKDLPIEDLVDVPRGSNLEEMLPYARALRDRVDLAYERVVAKLTLSDNRSLELDNLVARGLNVDDQELYEEVFASVRDELPAAQRRGLGYYPDYSINLGRITPGWSHEIDARRLDDSIREESNLRALVVAAENDVERLEHDLQSFARPVGVAPAVWILAGFSLLGIVLPLSAMAWGPNVLAGWAVAGLMICFVVGLVAVIGYMVWYARLASKADHDL